MSTHPAADREGDRQPPADPPSDPPPVGAAPSAASESGPPGETGGSASRDTGKAVATEADPRLSTIQPGGGVVMSIELAWGRLRRRLLRTLRPGYVRRMRERRRGTQGSLPLDPVDPRDLKYYQNQNTFWWDADDDPFSWRDRLPFVRAGLAELLLMTSAAVVIAAIAGWVWLPLAAPPLVVAVLVVWFFRNPSRTVPTAAGTVVSPADGKLVQIQRIDDPELGRSVQFGIFLSIFNVHANRASLPGRVVGVRYRPGKFLNALRPESSRENENLDLVLEPAEPIGGRFRIRQITGQFARRIVCWASPGQRLGRGEMYGMIKLGSRTELIVPDHEAIRIVASIGDKVSAGSTTLARYEHLARDDNGKPVASSEVGG